MKQPPKDRYVFGQLLRERRHASRKSLFDLSLCLGFSCGYLSDVELGRRSPLSDYDIRKAAPFIGADTDELLEAAKISRPALTTTPPGR